MSFEVCFRGIKDTYQSLDRFCPRSCFHPTCLAVAMAPEDPIEVPHPSRCREQLRTPSVTIEIYRHLPTFDLFECLGGTENE